MLVDGRYDVSGPLETAWRLQRAWPFYNVSYAEAVELCFAAPAGYTPQPVYSVSATTTVSGTVEGGNRSLVPARAAASGPQREARFRGETGT